MYGYVSGVEGERKLFISKFQMSSSYTFFPFNYNSKQVPGKIGQSLSRFQAMLILKAIRPDKVTNAMQNYVASTMGQKFIEPMSTDLAVVYKDSSPSSPLVFVLSSGTDPAKSLNEFAETMKMGKRLFSISLGQGQVMNAFEFVCCLMVIIVVNLLLF